MSGASRFQSALHRAQDALTRATVRARLRGATSLGANARTTGAPLVKNRGRLDIGRGFFLSSEPAPSHIVVSRGGRVTIGNDVAIGSGAAIACEAEVHIGDGVRIGRNVMILDTDFHDTASMGSPGASVPVFIEDGARLDDGVIVLKGARIGKNAWIGASSVVSGVVAPGIFASGVPARARRSMRSRGDAIDVAERVRAVIAETFELARALEPTDGPTEIVRWDSLGSLRLLLALEDEFDMHLAEDALYGKSSVAAVVEALESALDAA